MLRTFIARYTNTCTSKSINSIKDRIPQVNHIISLLTPTLLTQVLHIFHIHPTSRKPFLQTYGIQAPKLSSCQADHPYFCRPGHTLLDWHTGHHLLFHIHRTDMIGSNPLELHTHGKMQKDLQYDIKSDTKSIFKRNNMDYIYLQYVVQLILFAICISDLSHAVCIKAE